MRISDWSSDVCSSDLFDVILFKPVTGIEPTPEQAAAMDRKRKELGLPSGPAYFVNIRELVAEHSDSKTYGPLSAATRSEEHTSELQSLMRISYAVFCLKKKNITETSTNRPSTRPNTSP